MTDPPEMTRSARHQSARRRGDSRRRSPGRRGQDPSSAPLGGPGGEVPNRRGQSAPGPTGVAAGHAGSGGDGASPSEVTGGRSARRAAPRAAPRAGRNLWAAIAVGVSLGAVVAASLFVVKEVFLAVVAAAILLGVWEMRSAMRHAHMTVPLVPVAVGSVSMIVGPYVGGEEALTVTVGLTLVAVLLWRVADGVSGAVPDVTGGMLVTLYPCFLAGFASLMLAPPDGPRRIVTFVVITISSDIGGYAAGATIGKHPMAPSVSPKKSWEGFVGSVLACGIAGALTVTLLLGGPWLPGALLGLVVALTATLGDLMESLIKRDLGIKDMGSILPGHGGIMDRLDSLLITAPIAWAALLMIVPVA